MDDLILKCNQSILESQAALARVGEIQGELKNFRTTDDFVEVPRIYRSLGDLRPTSSYYVTRIPHRRPRIVPLFHTSRAFYERPLIEGEWAPAAHSSPKTNRRRLYMNKNSLFMKNITLATDDEVRTEVNPQDPEDKGTQEESPNADATNQSETQDVDEIKMSELKLDVEKENKSTSEEKVDEEKNLEILATSTPKRRIHSIYQKPIYRSLYTEKIIPKGTLQQAVMNGDIGVVQSLTLDGVNVNEVDKNGMTPLHHAVNGSQYGIVNLLLSIEEIQVNVTDAYSKTPLHYAVEIGLTQVVLALLNHGSYVNSTDNRKQTSLHMACKNGKHNIVDILMEHGASVYTFDDKMKAPLHYAVENNHTVVVTTMLRRGTPVDQSDGMQSKPLHYAARLGLFAMADILLDNGATVDSFDQDLKTPLFIAVENDLLSLVKTLISCNASVNVSDGERLTPLHIASHDGNVEMVTELTKRGARVDTTDCAKRTPLSYAVENSEVEVVQVLLLEGASVTVVDWQNKTPLHYAVINDDQLLIKILANHELYVAKSEKVYWRLLEIAFQHKNELVGEITINNALVNFVEKALQKKASPKHQEDAIVLMKSLLGMVCKHFNNMHDDHVTNVWAGYRENKEERPIIIANVSTYPISRRKEYMGVPVVYRLNNLVSDEAVALDHSWDEIERFADPLEIIAAQRVVNRNEARLRLEHSNLLKVSVSPVRSLQNGTLFGRETCIVFHCKLKGIIPFGEKCFPKIVDEFPVDVREGIYNLYTESSSLYHRLASPRLVRRKGAWISRRIPDYDARDDIDPIVDYLTDYELDYVERGIRNFMM